MVSQKIKNIIAITGLVTYLGWIASDKYFQHKSNEIRQNTPGVERSEKIHAELSALVDELENRTRNDDYRIDDIAQKYTAIATEYKTLMTQQAIKDAREKITSNNQHPANIILFVVGALCIGYTMFNVFNPFKEEETEQTQPPETTTA